MAINFKTPSQVGDEYLTELKALKPDVNTAQTDSDWWIRSRVVGGVMAGVYSDQRKISDDAFPQRARTEALARFLDVYFAGGFLPATQAQGPVLITGDIGTTVPAGLQMTYSPNGNAYQVVDSVVLSATGQEVAVASVATGQNQNLQGGALLTISSPPAGLNNTATVVGGLSDARDPETDTEARDRILQRIRQPLTVGRESDYIQYAKAASPSVVTASVVRYAFGLGTVAVYITSGTTDIDAAIDSGAAISIIPSDTLVDTVQAFLEQNKPITDCVTVLKPTAIPIDVTVKVRYRQGNGSTILTGQTLTQDQLVQREVRRALYKMPVGGRVFDSIGYIVASEIEETIDVGLSALPVSIGVLQILSDRQVADLATSGVNRMILPNEAPIPGTISVVSI